MNVKQVNRQRTVCPRQVSRRRIAIAGVTTAALSLPAIGVAAEPPAGQGERHAQSNVADNLPARTNERFRQFFESNFEDRESFESFLDRYFKQRPSTWPEKAQVPHAQWKLGVEVQSLSEEMARGLGMDEATGGAVTRVVENSPAENAGILVGDVITSLDAEKIAHPEDLRRRIANADSGDSLEVSVWRQGEIKHLRAELKSSDTKSRADATEPSKGRIGVHLVSITDESRAKYRLADDIDGALIIGTVPGSPAFERGLRAGDVIGMVGQTKVTTPEDVAASVQDAVRDGRDSVLVLIERDGARRFVSVEIG